MRYFLGLYDAAGYLNKLGKGLEENGHSIRYVNIGNDKFKYSNSRKYNLCKKLEELVTIYPSRSLQRLILFPALFLSRLYILINEIFRSDVFIFTGVQSFFDFHDLPIINFLGKKIVVIYIGSDARPPYLSGKHLDDNNGTFNAKKIHSESKKLKKRIERVERSASVVVNHVGTAQFFTKKCVMFSYLGIPYDNTIQNPKTNISQTESNQIRILHAPSRPKAKGSELFRQIAFKLQQLNKAIDYVEIQNKTNLEVIKEIQKCDIVLDELYSDMPLATFGVEASLLKKPVIVGGYFSRYISRSTPVDAIPPSIFFSPELLEKTLKDLIADRKNWRTIGEAQYIYVKKNYSPSVIANKIELMLAGTIPNEYCFLPTNENYIHGWGLSEVQLKEQLREYIHEIGKGGLLLGHNSKLENILIEFCKN